MKHDPYAGIVLDSERVARREQGLDRTGNRSDEDTLARHDGDTVAHRFARKDGIVRLRKM